MKKRRFPQGALRRTHGVVYRRADCDWVQGAENDSRFFAPQLILPSFPLCRRRRRRRSSFPKLQDLCCCVCLWIGTQRFYAAGGQGMHADQTLKRLAPLWPLLSPWQVHARTPLHEGHAWQTRGTVACLLTMRCCGKRAALPRHGSDRIQSGSLSSTQIAYRMINIILSDHDRSDLVRSCSPQRSCLGFPREDSSYWTTVSHTPTQRNPAQRKLSQATSNLRLPKLSQAIDWTHRLTHRMLAACC